MSASVARRLNYTGRSRIGQERITAGLKEVDRVPVLSASVELGDLGLPDDAEVVLEAARGTLIERCSLGTVAHQRPVVDRPLASFTSSSGIRIAVKVVDVGERAGRLLARSAPVAPVLDDEEPGARRSLLSFRSDDGLGQRIWALDVSGDHPVVLMNADLEDWSSVARSDAFVALVYPEILRTIACWVLDRLDDRDGECSVDDWVAFLTHLGRSPATIDDDRDEWAAEVAARFASHVGLRERYWPALSPEAT